MTNNAPYSSNKPYLINAIYQWIIDNGGTPYLTVDCKYPGVRVPVHAIKNGQITLNLHPRTAVNLKEVSGVWTFGTRFNQKHENIVIPLEAVTVIHDNDTPNKGMAFQVVYPENATNQHHVSAEDIEAVKAEAAAPARPRPTLTVVK